MPADSPSRVLLAHARGPVVTASSSPGAPVATAVPAVAGVQTGPREAEHVTESQVVIDLTGGSPPATTPGGRSGRRWLVALLALALVAAGLAVVNYHAALRWRARTIAAEQRAARSESEAAAQRRAAAAATAETARTQERRRAIAEQLAVSEADVAALEARIVALASDRARAEDRGAGVVTASADAQVRALQAQVDSCTAQVAAARSALTADPGDAASWQRALTAAQAGCEQVAADVDALVSSAR